MMPGGMMGAMGSWGMGYGLFGWLIMLLFWVAIITGIVLLVRWLIDQGKLKGQPQDSALDILKKRYARGEIDREQFENMKRELT